MQYYFISNTTPFIPLLDFNIGNVNIDLHNEFEYIKTQSKFDSIEFYFRKCITNNLFDESNAVIIFSEVIETNIHDVNSNNNQEWKALMNFARGDLREENKYFSNKDIKYFFIEFEGGELINILCKQALIILW